MFFKLISVEDSLKRIVVYRSNVEYVAEINSRNLEIRLLIRLEHEAEKKNTEENKSVKSDIEQWWRNKTKTRSAKYQESQNIIEKYTTHF